VTEKETIIMAEMDQKNGYTSSVGIATGYGRGSISSWGKKLFSSPQCPDRLCGLTSLLSSGYRGPSRKGVKRPRREIDHSSPFSVQNKNVGAIPSLPRMSSWRFTILFTLEIKYRTTDLKTEFLKFTHRKCLEYAVNFMSTHRNYELLPIFFNASSSPFRALAA
jgi:hypothetical protein